MARAHPGNPAAALRRGWRVPSHLSSFLFEERLRGTVYGHRSPAHPITWIVGPRGRGLGRRGRAAHATGAHSLVRRQRGGVPIARARARRQERLAAAQSGELSRLPFASLASVGCRSRRASHVRVHARPRRCGPQQPLDGARRGACEDGRAVRRLHEGAHDVRGALLHGTDRLALLALRRRNHRQRLRRAQHGAHDPRRPSPHSSASPAKASS